MGRNAVSPMPQDHHAVDVSCGRVDVLYHQGPLVPVLLIHGNSASKEIFAPQVQVLRQLGHGVLALDLPGHGASDDANNPSAVYSFPGYARIVAEVLDHFSLRQVHVVGWSLGGHIGLELMARDSRVASLLISGTPAARLRLADLTEAFHASPGMDYAGRREFTRDDAMAYGAAIAGGPAFLTPALLKTVQRTDGNARFWMVQNTMNGTGSDAWNLVETDARPLAVLHGEDDPFINLAYLRKPAYRNLWRGAVQVLPGVGHAPHWQAPARFNELLLAFLADVTASQQIQGARYGVTA